MRKSQSAPSGSPTKILVGALGYEARSSQFLLSNELENFKRVIIYDYESSGLHSYDENQSIVESVQHGDLKRLASKDALIAELQNICSQFGGSEICLTVDFSSIDRGLIAEILLTIYRNREKISYLEVLYYPQKFLEPRSKLETVTKFGPISPEFSGSARSSSEKLCMIVGAGYEFGKVIGAQDRLEPDELFAFTPVGTDPQFEDAINRANFGFEFIGSSDNIVKYDLSSPEDTFASLFELVRHKKATHRVLLLPMGPKLFAVFSILIAIKFHPDVRVWHYSTSQSGKVNSSDAYASGQEVSLNFSTNSIFGH